MLKKNSPLIILLFSTVLVLSLVSCTPRTRLEKEERTRINEYLSNNSNQAFVHKPSGLYYLEVLPGTGISPVKNDSVYILYTLKLLTGDIIDSNVSSGVPRGFLIGTDITGFDEGLMLMKQGGKSTLLIPSSLAYGAYGSYPVISGYTPLLFDVELVKVVQHYW